MGIFFYFRASLPQMDLRNCQVEIILTVIILLEQIRIIIEIIPREKILIILPTIPKRTGLYGKKQRILVNLSERD